MLNLQKAIKNLSEAKESIYEEASKLAFGVNPELQTALYASADQITSLIGSLQVIEFAEKPESIDVSKFDLDDLSIINA